MILSMSEIKPVARPLAGDGPFNWTQAGSIIFLLVAVGWPRAALKSIKPLK